MGEIRSKILNHEELASEPVDCPEWGVKVEVREMTVDARGKMVDRRSAEQSTSDFYASLVVACSFDPETGERVFEDADVDALKAKGNAPVERIAMKALDLAGVTKTAEDRAAATFRDEPDG